MNRQTPKASDREKESVYSKLCVLLKILPIEKGPPAVPEGFRYPLKVDTLWDNKNKKKNGEKAKAKRIASHDEALPEKEWAGVHSYLPG